MQRIVHSIEPVFDENSKKLVLGTLPSPKSREEGFFYAHPQNRFWGVLSRILNEPLPQTKADKIALLLKHGIALWDVVESCEISGAADSSIKNAKPNDFSKICAVADIKAVFTTGRKAEMLYRNLLHEDSIYLPSTSPANCALPFDKLCERYSIMLEYLK